MSRFFCVSNFLKRKCVESGLPPALLRTKRNFVFPAKSRRDGPGEHFLYFGRLAPEKGLRVLMHAWKSIDAQLLIAGDGPDRSVLEAMAPPNVTFLGAVDQLTLADLLRGARASLMPSLGFETSGRTIIESYAAGVPVIASNIGGIPEAISHGHTGFLVESGNNVEIESAARLLSNDSVSLSLGEGAYSEWKTGYTPQKGLENLLAAYEEAIEQPPDPVDTPR